MFKVASIYDEILNDKEVNKILLLFHSSNWNKLTNEDKISSINELDKRIMFLIGQPAHKIVFPTDLKGGRFVNPDNIINFSPYLLDDQYAFLEIYFHEQRHSLQHKMIEGKIDPKKFDVKEEQLNQWVLNNKIHDSKRINYISLTQPLYPFQPIETDAYYIGMVLAQKVALKLEKRFGKDKKFIEYIKKPTKKIEYYFLEDELSVLKRNERSKKVSDFYISNENKISNIKDEIPINKYMENIRKEEIKIDHERSISRTCKYLYDKGINNLNNNQLMFLLNDLSEFVFTKEENVVIGNELIKRLTVNKKEQLPVVSIKDDNYMIDNNSYSLKEWNNSKIKILLDAIVSNDLKDLSYIKKIVKKEGFLNLVELNLYQNCKGEYINKFDKEKTFYKNYFEPINILKRKLVNKVNKQIIESINYGCLYKDGYKEVEDIYNDNVESKKVELLTNRPFNDFFNLIIQQMTIKKEKSIESNKTLNK